jgi:hypothetical protein
MAPVSTVPAVPTSRNGAYRRAVGLDHAAQRRKVDPMLRESTGTRRSASLPRPQKSSARRKDPCAASDA